MSETLAMAFAPSEPTATGFDALYRAAAADLFAYVAALLRDPGAAEDVTALAFERAYRKWGRFDPRRGTPRQWLFGIARNAALDELRRRRRRSDSELADIPDPSAADDEQTARRLTVRAAMAGLEPHERELVALKFFAGLSNAEIAGLLGVSESNAGTKVHRAVTKLREACNV